MEKIHDGTGRGYLAAVTAENRLATIAVQIGLRSHISAVHGQSYTMNSSVLTLSAINTWHWVLFWQNTSTTRRLHVNTIEFNWNGGSTNFNRPLQSRNVLPSAGAPTANHTSVTMSNNNKTVANVAEMDVYKWDGVGAGMTNSAGPAGSDVFHPQGRSIIDFDGWVISSVDSKVGIQVKSAEIGDFSVGLGVYFIDKDAEI